MYTSLYPRALGLSLSAAESIELAAQARFDAVDLLVRDLVERGEDHAALRARMADLGVRPGAFAFPIDWRHDDEDRFAADIERLPRLLEVARSLGYLRTAAWILPGLDNATLPGIAAHPDDEAILEAHLRRLGPIVRKLAEFDIRLGIEVIGIPSYRRGRPWVHQLSDPRVDTLLDRLGRGAGLLVDAFHLHAAGEPPDTALLRGGAGTVVWVHVADLPADFQGSPEEIQDDDRGLPGDSGQVPVAHLLTLLQTAGYDGPVSPEPLATCRRLGGLDPLDRALAAREALDRVWPW